MREKRRNTKKAKGELVPGGSRAAVPRYEDDYPAEAGYDEYYTYEDGPYYRQDADGDYDGRARDLDYDEVYDGDGYDDYDDYYRRLSPKEEKALRKKALRRERIRKFKIAMTVLFFVLFLVAFGITAAGYFVTYSEANLPNLYVDGVFVGGMDYDRTLAALEESGWDEASQIPLKVSLMDTVSFEVDQCQSGARHTLQQAADAAWAYGHGSNWYKNLADFVRCYFRPVDINESSLVYNRDYVLGCIDSGIARLNEQLGDGSYEIDEGNSVMRIIKGAGQLQFDREAMTDAVFTALESDRTELSWTDISNSLKAPDFQAIFEELSAEPQDASYSDDNRFTVLPHVVGCDFDVEGAKELWNKAPNAALVEIPLDITYPEITSDFLESLLYRDVLGAMTTYFPNSNDNRISNINLAVSKINGLILYPGDVFSYNETLGQRTEEAGYLPAGAYENGEVVEEVGGGICQVSSTLYSAMLYGYKLTTVERYPHYFPVDYLEKGYDATVSWPKPDFKFRNDRDFPVKIVATCDTVGRSLTIEIMGTNLDGCFIELKKETLAYNNSRYPWIHEGWGVQVFRYVFDSYGMQVDQINEIYDIYHTHEATEQIKALDAQAAAAAAAGIPLA